MGRDKARPFPVNRLPATLALMPAYMLLQLLADETNARRMGQAGKAIVAEEFSIAAMVEGNLRVYQEILSRRPG